MPARKSLRGRDLTPASFAACNRSDRITRLYKAIAAICTTRSIELAVYRLHDIKACFRPVGAVTRQEIAETVARMIPAELLTGASSVWPSMVIS